MKRSLRDRVATRIARSQRDVFLTRDFADLSDEDQVIRALRSLVTQRSLVRLGKGVYAKARASPSRVARCWRMQQVSSWSPNKR